MRQRNPEVTRERLLLAGFREMRRVGFHGADVGRILEDAGVTKGALYHHFHSKRGLGYAVVEEILHPWILDRWVRPLSGRADPLLALAELARWGERHATADGLSLGCPLALLSEELCGLDEGFRARLARVYGDWQEQLADRLAEGQRLGRVRGGVDCGAAAVFIVAVWRGSTGLAKSHGGTDTLRRCRIALEAYLETLRPAPDR